MVETEIHRYRDLLVVLVQVDVMQSVGDSVDELFTECSDQLTRTLALPRRARCGGSDATEPAPTRWHWIDVGPDDLKHNYCAATETVLRDVAAESDARSQPPRALRLAVCGPRGRSAALRKAWDASVGGPLLGAYAVDAPPGFVSCSAAEPPGSTRSSADDDSR